MTKNFCPQGNFNVVPRDKEFFKLRSNIEKQLILTVSPAPPSTQANAIHASLEDLCVQRCFGLLVAPGRRVKHADMNLLEMVRLEIGFFLLIVVFFIIIIVF